MFELFHVVIVSIVFVSHVRNRQRLRRDGSRYGISLIGENTEAAPNSYTGSGRGMFPCSDGGALAIENVREHTSCMQIDASIECVRLLVEAHGYVLEKDEPS